MKLSIVTINYNNVGGLRKTLASVAAQTYRDIEHIVIDGGSTDGSIEVIKDYVNQLKIEDRRLKIDWVSEKDNGVYQAMNKGVKRATGDYILVLNSGDVLAASYVTERIMDVLMQGKSDEVRDKCEIDLLLGNIIQVYSGGKKKKEGVKCNIYGVKPSPMDVSMLTFYSGTVPHDAAFIRRNLFEKYGYFDEKMKICADWKLYLDMIALGGVQPWYVDIDVVLFDMSGISNTQNERRLAERRAYLEQVLPVAVLKDYDAYARPIRQYQRLKKHHLWGLVYFLERILFKLEKWHVLK